MIRGTPEARRLGYMNMKGIVKDLLGIQIICNRGTDSTGTGRNEMDGNGLTRDWKKGWIRDGQVWERRGCTERTDRCETPGKVWLGQKSEFFRRTDRCETPGKVWLGQKSEFPRRTDRCETPGKVWLGQIWLGQKSEFFWRTDRRETRAGIWLGQKSDWQSHVSGLSPRPVLVDLSTRWLQSSDGIWFLGVGYGQLHYISVFSWQHGRFLASFNKSKLLA